MQEKDFPGLYQDADTFSSTSQRYFLLALKWHLILLVIAAVLSVTNIAHWLVATLQLLILIGALSCSIYLFTQRPEKFWYAGRAVAESIKTISWRYICKAEPFQEDDAVADSNFHQKLIAIIEQNKDIASRLDVSSDKNQITQTMREMRALDLSDRKKNYAINRIKNQHSWYAKKASSNKQAANKFFGTLILINIVAVCCAALRIRFTEFMFWPTDILVAVAASLLSWMQAKRFSELSASYSLAATEIGLIHEQALLAKDDKEFSIFVGDAENAFSREHTQWVARRDA